MISRKLAGVSAASVGAATAVAALLLGTVPGSAESEINASAFGLSAEGLLPIDPTPQIVAPPDGQDALLELPSPLGVGVLTVKAAGNTSSATAVDLNLADVVVAQLIRASCDNGVGEVEILGGEIGDSALPTDPGLGTGLDLAPLANVEINRQSEGENGALTVDALVVSVLPGGQLPDLAITPDTLDQLGTIVPDLEVPSMEQLQSEQTTADQPPAEEPPADQPPAEEPPADQPPAEEPTAPTLEDLLAKLTELNPGLEIPTAEGDALLEIVVSSATCGAGKEDIPGEAPKPEPVETQLPVTH